MVRNLEGGYFGRFASNRQNFTFQNFLPIKYFFCEKNVCSEANKIAVTYIKGELQCHTRMKVYWSQRSVISIIF